MGTGRVTARSRRQVTNPRDFTTRFTAVRRSRRIVLVFAIVAGFVIALTSNAISGAAASQANQERTQLSATAEKVLATDELLQIVNQTSFVAADGVLTLDLQVALENLTAPSSEASLDADSDADGASTGADDSPTPSPDDRLTIEVTVFSRITDEADVDRPPTRPLNRVDPLPLSEVPIVVDGIGRELHRIQLPVRSGAPFDDRERVLIPEPGVYPMTVELHDSNGLLATHRTRFIRLAQETSGEATAAPIPVAVLLPVTAADGLTLADAVGLLESHPAHPITVALHEGTQSQLRSDPELAAQFVAAVGQRQIVTSSGLQLDPSALAEIGQDAVYANSVKADREGYEELGLSINPTMNIIDTPLTEQGARALLSTGTKTVIGNNQDSGGFLAVDGSRLDLVTIDDSMSSTFATDDSGPIVATQVLAKLVLRGEADNSAVVLGGLAMGQRPLAALDAFLIALSQPGAPQPVAVADIKRDTALRPAERPSQDLGPLAASLVAIQNGIATYESSYQAGGIPPRQFRDRMLASLSRTRNQADRERSLDLVARQLSEELDVISLPESQPVNLAARSAPIPLVVESRAKGPRMVMVKFVSDKISVSRDEQVILVEPGTSSVDVEVEARSLGVSPLEVSIWTPDGKEQLALTTFQVRSTAIPGVGLLLSTIGIVLLCSWWWVDNRRRTKERIAAEAASLDISAHG